MHGEFSPEQQFSLVYKNNTKLVKFDKSIAVVSHFPSKIRRKYVWRYCSMRHSLC